MTDAYRQWRSLAIDGILRLHGWRIVSRPNVGQALWRGPDGDVATQEQAFQAVFKATTQPEHVEVSRWCTVLAAIVFVLAVPFHALRAVANAGRCNVARLWRRLSRITSR